ncbi:MAG: TolC family protein [Verrucomicrobia bacterium]|jgi:outer membrane protein TolC|nr:TolC family protein [Verrucomicrobiota bacterium]|tara:strand:+ start:9341 stop:11728 length:2388 start_codon:yes stop_codon:yes gene_type:complete
MITIKPDRRIAWILLAALCFSFLNLRAQEIKRIAIVRDSDSAHFDSLIVGIEEELKILASDRYRFETVDRFNALGDGDAIRVKLLQAIKDPAIDVVYTAGVVSSYIAENLPAALRTKPVVAGAVEFSKLNNESISENGTSTIPNFTFVLEARRVQSDLAELSRISGKKKLYAIIDSLAIERLAEEFSERIPAVEKQLGIDIVVIPATTTASGALANLPSSAKAVYISIINGYKLGERGKLLSGLNQRGVISMSMLGEVDVKAGALASLSPDSSLALHRRCATNLHQIFSGISTTLLPVVLRSNDTLRINMKTAEVIGWSPDYETLLSAELIDLETIQQFDASLSIDQAMKLSAENNASIRLAKARLSATYWEAKNLKTQRFPQLSITGSARKSGVADRINRATEANTDSLLIGAEVSQLLYSDRLTSQIRAKAQDEAASTFDLESVHLDSMQETGNAYLDCLLADALYEIEKENLSLAGQNLNLAKTRRDIGAAEPSEIFRWLSSYADAKSNLIQRDATRKNARFALNVALGIRAGTNYRLKDIGLGEKDVYFMDEELRPLINNLDMFEKYIGFIKEMSLWRAPEISAFDKSLASQGILFKERGRRNFHPEVSLTASFNRFITETSQNYDGQSEWTVGIGFRIPLSEGGLRRTEQQRIAAVIRQLEAQRDNAIYLIEQSALTNAYQSAASHPAVRLTRDAQNASEKYYESVQEKYTRGATSILDLLDAQTDLINRRRSAASAKYAFLSDTIGIQRSMAWFEFSSTPEEKAAWTRMLRSYLQTGSLHIEHITKEQQ